MLTFNLFRLFFSKCFNSVCVACSPQHPSASVIGFVMLLFTLYVTKLEAMSTC